ncbi:MAG: hypothetical protein H6715_05950 [Myxococcales bacterium]|nr:hypothetical protein [Myxococcales bacterium]MCB9708320.1 hypothetical protein [Myxococcales bacterium]
MLRLQRPFWLLGVCIGVAGYGCAPEGVLDTEGARDANVSNVSSVSEETMAAWRTSCEVVRESLCTHIADDLIMDQISASCAVDRDPESYCAGSGPGGAALNYYLDTRTMDGLELSEVAMLGTIIEALELPVEDPVGAPPGMADKMETLKDNLRERLATSDAEDRRQDAHWLLMGSSKGSCTHKDIEHCLDWCIEQCARKARTDIQCVRQCFADQVPTHTWQQLGARQVNTVGKNWEDEIEKELREREKSLKKFVLVDRPNGGAAPVAQWASTEAAEAFTLLRGVQVPYNVDGHKVMILVTWSAAAAIVMYAGYEAALFASPLRWMSALYYLFLMPQEPDQPLFAFRSDLREIIAEM